MLQKQQESLHSSFQVHNLALKNLKVVAKINIHKAESQEQNFKIQYSKRLFQEPEAGNIIPFVVTKHVCIEALGICQWLH